MLNPLPDLLTFSLLAPTIIRVALGFYFIWQGFSIAQKLYHTKEVAIDVKQVAEEEQQETPHMTKEVAWHKTSFVLLIGSFLFVVAGISVLVGFLTQVGALALGSISLYHVFSKHHQKTLYFLLLLMSLSLLFSGAGFLAFDIPL